MDVYGNCYIWSWSSTKCQRVTRSVLAAELYALAHGYDAGFNFAYAPENILKRIWKSNYWQIRKRYYLLWREKLLVDIFGIRDTYRNSEISNIGYIDSQYILLQMNWQKFMNRNSIYDVLENTFNNAYTTMDWKRTTSAKLLMFSNYGSQKEEGEEETENFALEISNQKEIPNINWIHLLLELRNLWSWKFLLVSNWSKRST